MFKKKGLVLLLALAMVFSSVPGVYAVDVVTTTAPALEFVDMPSETFWSTAALKAAVSNGLLNGFSEEGAMYIKAEASLTRAEMATIINRAFGATAQALITDVVDISEADWYASDMAKAVQMGTFMLDTQMRPKDSITRQEAFVVLARAFKLSDQSTDYTALNKFSDKADIESWAIADLSGMTAAGYIEGSGGKLNPQSTITRQEFATVMNNMVKQYIDQAGTYKKVVSSGNVVIRVTGVTLKGVTVNGDLIVADGVGNGDATFENIKVVGRAVIRGGGSNSIVFTGFDTDVKNIVIARGSDGIVRIMTEDGAILAEATIEGDGNVILDGSFGIVHIVSSDITVTISSATEIEEIQISGQDVNIIGDGSLETVTILPGGDGASITTPDTTITVAEGVTGVTAGGGAQVLGGETVTNNEEGDDIVMIGGGGGGGGVVTPALSIAIQEVTTSNGAVTVAPAAGLYTIPSYADENNTGIDVAISNTIDVTYSVTMSIKNGSTTMASATAVGLEQIYLDLLDAYGDIEFSDMAAMFDRLGTSRSGWYIDVNGDTIQSTTGDSGVFQGIVSDLFDRMDDGPTIDTYTVTVTLTPSSGTAASVTFNVKKDR